MQQDRKSATYRLPIWLLELVEGESQTTGNTGTRVVELALQAYLGERCEKCGQAVITDA